MSFSYQQALAGLDASAKQLDVVGNNISNASTTGFKRSRVAFGDVYANSLAAVSNNPIGLGVGVQSISRLFSQGGLTTTNNPLDAGISGDGFFVVRDTLTNNPFYTRSGQFGVDSSGFLVTTGGQRVLGYPASAGDSPTGIPTFALQVPTGSKDATVTTKIDASFNLNASSAIKTDAVDGAFDPTKSGTYNHTSTLKVVDEVGEAHTLSLYFRRVDSQKWDVYSLLADGNESLKPTVTAPSGSSSLPDTIKPVIASAYVVPFGTVPINTAGGFSSSGQDIVLQYRENKSLFDTTAPAASAFTVKDANNVTYTVSSVSIDANNNRVILNTSGIPSGTAVNVSYTPPNTNPIADAAGNAAASFAAQAATNRLVVTDTTVPLLSSASVSGDKLVLKYADGNLLDRSAAGTPANADFSLNVNGTAIAGSSAFTGTPVIDPVEQTVTLTLATAITAGQTVKLDYTPGTNRIRDIAATPNNAAALSNQTILNFTASAPKVATLNFSGAGALQDADLAYADLSFALATTPGGTGPTATTPFAFRLNLASIDPENSFATTAFANTFAPSKLNQDGRVSVSVTGYGIDDSGNFFARYSDGLTETTGKIALANFKSPEGLVAVTGNLFAATLSSGEPQAASPNSNTSNGRLGLIKSGTLESANVDLTAELVALITAQRNYQANAKSISVQTQAAQAILQAV